MDDRSGSESERDGFLFKARVIARGRESWRILEIGGGGGEVMEV